MKLRRPVSKRSAATCVIATLALGIGCGKTRRSESEGSSDGGAGAPSLDGTRGVVIGALPGGRCSARAVSRDGSAAAGFCVTEASQAVHATLWQLETPPSVTSLDVGENASATALNQDGSVVIGVKDDVTFRWSTSGETTLIPELRLPTGVSADGSRVIGTCLIEGGYERACTWTEAGGATLLPASEPGENSWANAVSADGQVIVGYSLSSGGRTHPVRWYLKGDPEVLPAPGDAWVARADAISADGTTVGGIAWLDDVAHPARWPGVGFQLREATARVVALSSDGERVLLDQANTPYLWEPDGEVWSAFDVFGESLPLEAWEFGSVWGASSDLRVIVGDGRDSRSADAAGSYVIRLEE